MRRLADTPTRPSRISVSPSQYPPLRRGQLVRVRFGGYEGMTGRLVSDPPRNGRDICIRMTANGGEFIVDRRMVELVDPRPMTAAEFRRAMREGSSA